MLFFVVVACRAELQRAFFPAAYQDAKQAVFLKAGENRVWTTLRVFVELRGGTTLYIPFREASKVRGVAVAVGICVFACACADCVAELAMGR